MKLVVRMDSHIGWNFVTWLSIGMMSFPLIDFVDDVLGFDLPPVFAPYFVKGGWSLDPVTLYLTPQPSNLPPSFQVVTMTDSQKTIEINDAVFCEHYKEVVRPDKSTSIIVYRPILTI